MQSKSLALVGIALCASRMSATSTSGPAGPNVPPNVSMVSCVRYSMSSGAQGLGRGIALPATPALRRALGLVARQRQLDSAQAGLDGAADGTRGQLVALGLQPGALLVQGHRLARRGAM